MNEGTPCISFFVSVFFCNLNKTGKSNKNVQFDGTSCCPESSNQGKLKKNRRMGNFAKEFAFVCKLCTNLSAVRGVILFFTMYGL